MQTTKWIVGLHGWVFTTPYQGTLFTGFVFSTQLCLGSLHYNTERVSSQPLNKFLNKFLKMHDRKREEQSEASKQLLAAKIGAYKGLMEACLKLRGGKVYTAEALKMTDKILMINPEFYTMWNYRREILKHLIEQEEGLMVWDAGACGGVAYPKGAVSLRYTEAELLFNARIIETRDHKSYSVWHNRRLLLSSLSPEDQLRHLRNELLLIARLLKVDDRNFHCWGHRSFVTTKLREVEAYSDREELSFTRQRVEANFSNYSAYHARSKVLLQGTPEEQAKKVSAELEMVQNAFYTEAGDQSGWMYALWLLKSAPSPEAESLITQASQELLEDEATLKWPQLALLTLGATEEDPKKVLDELIKTDPAKAGYYAEVKKGYE